MSTQFGTWLYEAVTKMTDEHRKFFLSREDQRYGNRGHRCTGMSSDAMVYYALGLSKAPTGWWSYPRDKGDLNACELTYEMAPADLQERMLPVLEKYRHYVESQAA